MTRTGQARLRADACPAILPQSLREVAASREASLPLKIERQSPTEGVALLLAQGEIDAHSFEAVEDAVNETVDDGVIKVLVDLSKVSYMSSAGIGVLIGSMNEVVDGHGGAFVLISPTASVLEVLESMGFTAVFTIVQSLDEALSSVAG